MLAEGLVELGEILSLPFGVVKIAVVQAVDRVLVSCLSLADLKVSARGAHGRQEDSWSLAISATSIHPVGTRCPALTPADVGRLVARGRKP